MTASPAAAAAASPASASPEAGAEADSVPGNLGCAKGSHGAAAAEWVITKEHVEALAIGNVTQPVPGCSHTVTQISW